MKKSKSLKKNAVANYIGQFYSIFIGVLILPLYLNILGSESYGLVGFFTMLSSWMMLLDIGLSPTLSREASVLKDSKSGLLEFKILLRNIEFIFYFFSFFSFILIFSFKDFIVQSWLNIITLNIHMVSNIIILMGLMFTIKWFVGLYQGIIIGFEEQVWLNKYKIFINTLKFVGAYLLIKYITNDIFIFFIYQFSISIIEYIVIRYKVYRYLPLSDKFILPDLEPIKKIGPFALSIAFTSGIWTVFTQFDKLLLSHYLSLSNYGFYTLVIVFSNVFIQMSNPINQAILPRLTKLCTDGNLKDMLQLYHISTQVIAVIMVSLTAIISYFSYEILYAWTGNIEASLWDTKILMWYTLGNGILAFLSLPYNLQYAFGNLKYHVRFNIIFPFFAIPIIYFSIEKYSVIGASMTWFGLQFISFIIWPKFVHTKFLNGNNFNWYVKDVFPVFINTSIFIYVLDMVNIDFLSLNRIEIFLVLIAIGLMLLISNFFSLILIKNSITYNFFKGYLNR